MSLSQKAEELLKQHLQAVKERFPFGPNQEFRNEEGFLHREGGPAYISPDRVTYYINGMYHGPNADIYGTVTWYYENIVVPEEYFTHPENLTVDKILNNPNQEVRYVGMRIYGFDRMCDEGHVRLIHEDKERNYLLFSFQHSSLPEELRFVKVLNATPEPDGTSKEYYLQVPPDIDDAHAAVAWTFGMTKEQYNPQFES